MKYEALKLFFAAQRRPRLRMTFEEVARAAKVRLPASAYEHPAWWANDSSSHVQAKAWLDARYRTENVDIEAQSVEFVRAEARAQGVREMQEAFEHHREHADMHPAFGALKGTFTIEPGWDLTKPALDEGELAEWEANLDRKADLVEKSLRGEK
jgi:hypothetical protein